MTDRPYGYSYRWASEPWKWDINYLTPAGALEAAIKKMRDGYAVALSHLTVDEMNRHAETQKIR